MKDQRLERKATSKAEKREKRIAFFVGDFIQSNSGLTKMIPNLMNVYRICINSYVCSYGGFKLT